MTPERAERILLLSAVAAEYGYHWEVQPGQTDVFVCVHTATGTKLQGTWHLTAGADFYRQTLGAIGEQNEKAK